MKELLQKLSKNDIVLGSFYFKGSENQSSFTGTYSISESRIKRVALVLTQTMDALGGISFDRFSLEGKDKRVSIYRCNDGYCGIVFQKNVPFRSIEKIYKSLISITPPVEKVIEKEKVEEKEKPIPKIPEKEEEIFPPAVFNNIKDVLSQYLGDFSETIFENQMSDMGIKPESTTVSKVKKLCFSLQKASAMLIGPSNAAEMVDKLLAVIKSAQTTSA